MFIAYAIVAVLLAAVLTMSAIAKLRKVERVVEGISVKAKVPLSWFPRLAALELLGAAGLLIGVAVPLIGIAAGTGIVLYFIGAVSFHLRAKDPAVMPALTLGVFGAAALALRILSR